MHINENYKKDLDIKFEPTPEQMKKWQNVMLRDKRKREKSEASSKKVALTSLFLIIVLLLVNYFVSL